MELPNYIKIILGFLVVVLVGNVVFLDYFFVTQRSEVLDLKARMSQFSDSVKAAVERNYLTPAETAPSAPSTSPQTTTPTVTSQTSCPQSCLPLIDSAITAHAAKSVTTVPATTTTTTQGLRGEYFINLGTGSVLNSEASSTNWKTLTSAQATFDISNYSNVKSITLELFMHADNSGEVHARLFDATTPAIIWGSELSVASNTSTYKSAPISLTGGNKTYKIQMYSLLTTGYLDQARIHIVTQ